VDERERRMEWDAEAGRDYSGWLTVTNHGEGGSEVVAHLSFGECSLRRFDTTSDTTSGGSWFESSITHFRNPTLQCPEAIRN
jgi:hypothetical protein